MEFLVVQNKAWAGDRSNGDANDDGLSSGELPSADRLKAGSTRQSNATISLLQNPRRPH
jgi:hypothetical protein